MRASIDTLIHLNPGCDYYPPGYDQAAWERSRFKLGRFAEGLLKAFGEPFALSNPDWVQDATYSAEIYIPSKLIIGEGSVVPHIRVSNHGDLFVITVVRRLQPDTELLIEKVAEDVGYIYTPEALFGAPFDLRDRFEGDLFNQLYDYV